MVLKKESAYSVGFAQRSQFLFDGLPCFDEARDGVLLWAERPEGIHSYSVHAIPQRAH